jgi:hypothetical protein
MGNFIDRLLENNQLIPVLAIVGGLVVGGLWIVIGTVHSMVVRTAREKTKQELAAYVAAGTLDADKAIAMIKADKADDDSGCWT